MSSTKDGVKKVMNLLKRYNVVFVGDEGLRDALVKLEDKYGLCSPPTPEQIKTMAVLDYRDAIYEALSTVQVPSVLLEKRPEVK